MTNEELLSVAEIVERATNRFNAQAVNFQERCNKYEKLMADMKAEHEAKMVEHRAAFGARTEADAKIIAGLREERDGLLTQVQDMRVALAKEQELHAKTALRLSTEAAKLAQSKKGAWVKTTDGRVLSVRGYMVRLSPDREEFYDGSTCTPCDPPAADHDTPEGKQVAESVIRDDRKTEPKPGDVVRLVRIPSRADVSPELQTNLEWPWLERWGTLNQTAMVVKPAHQLAGAVPVCLSTNVRARWPICCVEVVRTEPDEIKVGDVVEVFRDSSGNTLKTDVGIIGKVLKLYSDFIDGERLVMLDPESQNRQSEGGCHYALCDVRKVTT